MSLAGQLEELLRHSNTISVLHIRRVRLTGKLQKKGLNMHKLCLSDIQILKTSIRFDLATRYTLALDHKENYL
jgi:hypothetical protein